MFRKEKCEEEGGRETDGLEIPLGYSPSYAFSGYVRHSLGFPGGARGKDAGDIRHEVSSLGQEDLLEEGMATHSSILAWGIPWTEGPGGLQSIGSQRVRHD